MLCLIKIVVFALTHTFTDVGISRYVLHGELERAATTYLNAQKQLRDLNETLWVGGVMESYVEPVFSYRSYC